MVVPIHIDHTTTAVDSAGWPAGGCKLRWARRIAADHDSSHGPQIDCSNSEHPGGHGRLSEAVA